MGTGSRWENASKEGSWPAAGLRFSCQAGRCPISGAGVFGPVAERAAWSAAIAQLVEHVIRNDGVTGSNPVCGTKEINYLAVLPAILEKLCPRGVRNAVAGCRIDPRFDRSRARSASRSQSPGCHPPSQRSRWSRNRGEVPSPPNDRCRRIHRVPISRITSRERTGRRTGWRKAAPARPPKITSGAPAERFQRAVGVENFDAGARPRVDVIERVMACALVGIESHVCLLEGEPARQRLCAPLLRSGSSRPDRAGDTAEQRARLIGAASWGPQAAISEGSARATPRR